MMRRLRDEGGSTLVVVLIVMLVLSIGGLALAAVVANTTSGLVHSRGTAQSRAAADAGIAAAVAEARRTGGFCPATDPTSFAHFLPTAASPRPAGLDYTVRSRCENGQVTFESTGATADGRTTKTESVYSYVAGSTPSGIAELVFFNSGSQSVYFTNNVMPQNSGMATILFPGGGSFQCKTTIPGNVVTSGSILGQSGCTITGSVYAGGQNPVSGGYGLYLNNSDQVLGNAIVNGNVLMGNSPAKIGGTLTLPGTAKLTANWSQLAGTPTSNALINGGKANGIVWSPTLGAPTLDPWFDYDYRAGDWPGYQVTTLTNTSSPYNCTNWKGSSTTFWTSYVQNLAQNTVIDARACKGGMDTDQGATSVASIGVNVVFLANAYTLGKLTLSPKTGTDPSAWFIVPDTVNDGKPTCPANDSANNWDYKIETDAAVNVTVRTMIYTPCDLRIGQGGTWTGAMYAGNFVDGGGVKIYTDPMGLPGQWGFGAGGSGTPMPTSNALGTLISQRDVP